MVRDVELKPGELEDEEDDLGVLFDRGFEKLLEDLLVGGLSVGELLIDLDCLTLKIASSRVALIIILINIRF